MTLTRVNSLRCCMRRAYHVKPGEDSLFSVNPEDREPCLRTKGSESAVNVQDS